MSGRNTNLWTKQSHHWTKLSPWTIQHLQTKQIFRRSQSSDEANLQTNHVASTFVFVSGQPCSGDFHGHQSTRARSEAASCGGGEEISPLDPVEEEKLRNKSWLVAVGGKNP
ncbi:hypothetical protein Fmac_008449 [Flemingia macrophylla]|uniref:Uncharacterized protein n=1 Tax=Flemingia macrophylla TaxID=520843 RepID=A0ABD1MXI1_9FABA